MKERFPLLAAGLSLLFVLSWAGFGQPRGPLAFPDPGPVSRVIARYQTDHEELDRFYGARVLSTAHAERLRKFYRDIGTSLQKIDFAPLSQASQIDYLLTKHLVEYREHSLVTRQAKLKEIEPLIPFKDEILTLSAKLRQGEPVSPRQSAGQLAELHQAVSTLAGRLNAGDLMTTPVLARRAKRPSLNSKSNSKPGSAFTMGLIRNFRGGPASPMLRSRRH